MLVLGSTQTPAGEVAVANVRWGYCSHGTTLHSPGRLASRHTRLGGPRLCSPSLRITDLGLLTIERDGSTRWLAPGDAYSLLNPNPHSPPPPPPPPNQVISGLVPNLRSHHLISSPYADGHLPFLGIQGIQVASLRVKNALRVGGTAEVKGDSGKYVGK